MRLKCGNCGRIVSTEVPDGTIVRAWIECPECLRNKNQKKNSLALDSGCCGGEFNIEDEDSGQ